MKKKKVRIKYKNFIPIILFIIILVLLIKSCNKEETKLEIPDFTNKELSDVIEFCNLNNLEYKEEYSYSFDVDENKIISYKEENNIIKVNISKGINIEELKGKNVNENGKIPVMMYHGIQNVTSVYGNGNIDKNGYNRTSEAFRNDLDFYYNSGYRFIRLEDYIDGVIDVELGYSPIVLTFDDGNANNCKVTGIDDKGNIIIDPDSAVGIMEEFKKKHPDSNITATFFITGNLFNQKEYNSKILEYLVNNGYDIGNHTIGHNNISKIDANKTQEVIGKMYQKLDEIIPNKYVKIVANPEGGGASRSSSNFKYVINGIYDGYEYKTKACLKVGCTPEVSPFNINFDSETLSRVRAFDTSGIASDDVYTIENTFNRLEKNRYISDGNKDIVTIKKDDLSKINTNLKVITLD